MAARKNTLRIFISHESKDECLAAILKDFIEGIFLNANVFVSGRDLVGGEIWINRIKEELEEATAIVSLVSSRLERSAWLYFECGAGFMTGKTIPLCADKLNVRDLPPPLSLLQARNLDAEGLKRLVQDIAKLALLRAPSQCPGLAEALSQAENFLHTRREQQSNAKSESDRAAKESPPDPKLRKYHDRLDSRMRDLEIRRFAPAREVHPDIPGEEELRLMTPEDRYEISKFYNIRYSPSWERYPIGYCLPLPRESDSKWQKLNYTKLLKSVEKDIDDFEADLNEGRWKQT